MDNKNSFNLKFSILIPSYNGGDVLGDTIRSILSQSFTNFEIIVQDDVSKDSTEEVVKSFKDKRISFYKNKKNLGYPGNLDSLSKRGDGEIIYLMGQDDILADGALMNTYNAFMRSKDIGVVARPYYWFDQDIKIPVRATKQLNPKKDEIVKITDEPSRVVLTIDVAGQLSALAYRRAFLERPFHPDIFPCHVYPFIGIMLKHPAVFLKDYNLAVRISSSQCRSVSSIYDKSPVRSWVDFGNAMFTDPKLADLKQYFIKNYVARNYVGLVQIRNYARYRYLLREIGLLLKYRWQNIYNPSFWFYSLGCMIIPPAWLIPLVDWYKNKINSKKFKGIFINYKLV